MIDKKIRILIVEDNMADAILIERQIRKIVAFPKLLHIVDFEDFKKSVELFSPDVILCDYQLDGFTGFDVLNFIGTLDRYIYLIFITGTINDEELAASSILTGASGYILKKNINSLHEKLEPHFLSIIESKEEDTITTEHEKIFAEMQAYLKAVREDNKMIRASYLEMKRALDKIKSLNK